jgi:hypothetical protein
MTLSCEQCVDIVALAIEIQKEITSQFYGQEISSTVENSSASISYRVDDEGDVSITRVFVQNQESKKLANLLTDYFNE